MVRRSVPPGRSAAFAAAAALALATTPAAAHHSSAPYDRANPITLTGVVKDLQWMNPHSWIELIGAPESGGHSGVWTIELEGPNVMQREGWTRTSVVPGDRVKVRVMPLKDGRPGARLIELTKSNGATFYLFTPRTGGVRPLPNGPAAPTGRVIPG